MYHSTNGREKDMRNISALLLPVLMTLVLCFGVCGKMKAQPGFSSLMTVNFDVKYQRGVEEPDARRIADYLQAEYEFLSRKLGLAIEKRVEVRIYSSVGKYLEATNQQTPWRSVVLTRNAIHMQPVQELMKKREFEKFLTFELSLAVLEQTAGLGCPRWLREACGVYHSGLMTDLRPPTGGKTGSFTDLDQDLQTYTTPPRRDDILYLVGETFTFFVESYGEEKAFGLFKSFDGTKSAESVIQTAFEKDYADIEREWAVHIATKVEPVKKAK
jgi:hypothetical protein